MTPPEQIIAFLRDHPDSTRAQINKHCGNELNWALRWLKVLILQGNIVRRRINKSEVRYTLVDDVIKDIRVDGRYNAAIRSLIEFEKFKKYVRPMIASMPGRSAAFYAEMLGQHVSSVSRRLNEMKRMGILFSDRRRRKRMKNKAALWWIKGSEPEDLDSVETPEEQIRDRCYGKDRRPKITIKAKAVYHQSDDNDQWLNEIRKTREQRRLERLSDENQQMPIPSYAEFFKRQEGRN